MKPEILVQAENSHLYSIKVNDNGKEIFKRNFTSKNRFKEQLNKVINGIYELPKPGKPLKNK